MHTRSHRHDGHASSTVVAVRKRRQSIPSLDPASSVDPGNEIDPEVRYRMISEAAYHLYEARGFEDGYDIEDWLAAEAVVDRLMTRRQGGGEGDGQTT